MGRQRRSLGSRASKVPAGATPSPDGRFMAQVVRNLADAVDGILSRKRYLLVDRDSKVTGEIIEHERLGGLLRFCTRAAA